MSLYSSMVRTAEPRAPHKLARTRPQQSILRDIFNGLGLVIAIIAAFVIADLAAKSLVTRAANHPSTISQGN